LLGLAGAAGFLLADPLLALGVLTPSMVGPPPWIALVWAFLVFSLPLALGIGALFTMAAIRTRSAAGPFGVSALLVALWMTSMVVLRGGGMDPGIATLFDPSGYAEAEQQTNLWTPAEKTTRLIALSAPLLLNRLIWCVAPLIPFAVVLLRLRREDLVLGQRRRKPVVRVRDGLPSKPSSAEREIFPRPEAPAWLRATLDEGRWQLARSFRSWPLWMALVLMTLMGVLGSFVHVVGHAEGPLVPRPSVLIPMLSEFNYLVYVFVVAGFVGVMMRRDERPGFDEITFATAAPLGVRLGGRVLAAAGMIASLAAVMTLASYIVMALAAPAAFSLGTPLFFAGGVYSVALLEVAVTAIFLHALFRSPSAAHSLTMLFAFIYVLNHELSLVTYPPGQVGLPVEIEISSLVGWAPWGEVLASHTLFKLATCALGIALAWLVWPRSVERGVRHRSQVFFRRLGGGGGVLAAVSIVVLVASGSYLYDGFVLRGEYLSHSAEYANRAAWEKRWTRDAASMSVEGGDVQLTVDVASRTVDVRWRLEGLKSPERVLHGELPAGATLKAVTVQGANTPFEVASDHFAVALGGCASAEGCNAELELEVAELGLPVPHEGVPWIHASQVWLTSDLILPRLGLDPQQILRDPSLRAKHALPPNPEDREPLASVPVEGVAGHGRWTWSAETPGGGWTTGSGREIEGPLDFAWVWKPTPLARSERGDMTAWHTRDMASAADALLEDIDVMRGCVAQRLPGAGKDLRSVIAGPPGTSMQVHGDLFWVPEQRNWVVGDEGFGRWRRRADFAGAMARDWLSSQGDLRRGGGSNFVSEGIAGWIGLSCVLEKDGPIAWKALVERESVAVIEALGALAAPAEGFDAGVGTDWVQAYAPLATFAWAQRRPESEVLALVRGLLSRTSSTSAPSVAVALRELLGPDEAAGLLGPPRASDVTVTAGASRELPTISSRRWLWEDGGWAPGTPSEQIVLLSRIDEDADRRWVRPGERLSPPAEDTTALDAWSSFEKTISDNVWAAPAKPTLPAPARTH
ncbi:MAG: hypothetical protein AAFU79_03595, partial [Myxococcota bacterium]